MFTYTIYRFSENVNIIFSDYTNFYFYFKGGFFLGYITSIGARMRQARKKKHLTLAEISEYTGLSTGNLSELENNKFMPSSNALISLKKVLDVSIDWLLTGEENVPVNYTGKNVVDGREQIVAKESDNMVYVLNEEEKKLLESFRKIGDDNRRDILGYINVCLSVANSSKEI